MTTRDNGKETGQASGSPVLTQLASAVLICATAGLGGGFYKLYDSYVAFDQHKDDQTQRLEERSKKLDSRELDLAKAEAQLVQSQQQLSKEQAVAQEAVSQANQRSKAASAIMTELSPEVRQANAETEIKKLMSEYAALGIDAGDQEPCDAEAKKRYYQAKAIRAQMVSIAQANGLYEKYVIYLDSGVHTFSFDADRCKPGSAGNGAA